MFCRLLLGLYFQVGMRMSTMLGRHDAILLGDKVTAFDEVGRPKQAEVRRWDSFRPSCSLALIKNHMTLTRLRKHII